MDKLHLRGKNRWENRLSLALMSFQCSLDQKVTVSPQSTIRHKSVLAWSPVGKEEETHLNTMVSMRRYFSLIGQKSCIDKGHLKITVKDMSTSSWLCFDQNRCLLGLGIYFQKIMTPKRRESSSADVLVHLPKQGKATNFFSWGFLPKWGRLAQGPRFLKGPLLSHLVLAAW